MSLEEHMRKEWMRKPAALASAVALVLAVSACADDNPTDTTDSGISDTTGGVTDTTVGDITTTTLAEEMTTTTAAG
jgi:hypothetical protein